jgi:DNA recombination protein RmuC
MPTIEFGLLVIALIGLLLLIGLVVALLRQARLSRQIAELPETLFPQTEAQHRAMLTELHEGLARQTERQTSTQSENLERLRAATALELHQARSAISLELHQARASLHALQLAQQETLGENRTELTQQLSELNLVTQRKLDALRSELVGQTLERLGEQARGQNELIQATFKRTAEQITQSIDVLTRTVDGRLESIGGKVSERLDEGFKRTNETFTNVMARLATIDEAQKNIEGLASNVVSLQQLLGDKRARGAFGEVQLEALVRNILPPNAYELQYTLPNGTRVDCVLKLPEPTGMVAVDSKFPLENYQRMVDADLSEIERAQAQRQFKLDVRRHIEDIATKYILAGVTSDGAVMFLPAEAVFAELHAYHFDIVDYAMQRRVWLVSPTTLMAVLNTARAVLKDVETRKQVHIIKDELGKLGREFGRFDERMRKLAEHIKQAHDDAQDVSTTSRKITARFGQIERVELDADAPRQLQLIEGEPD